MQIQEFISLLNGDLALEWSACIQYRQHAAVINGEFYAFSKELYEHADEEFEHAKEIAQLITNLGGLPGISVGPIYVSADNLAMLQQDLDGEETAIARYQERVQQAAESGRGMPILDGFSIAFNPLYDILSQEAGHRTDLKSMLGRS